MQRFASGLLLLATALFAARSVSGAPLTDRETRSRFEAWQTVILVHVVESTFPSALEFPDRYPLGGEATVLVLKSWKGPFVAGLTLHVATPGFCAGSSCLPYPLQAGQDVLIFDQRTEDPLMAMEQFVSTAADSKEAMATLDQLMQGPSSLGPNQRLERP